ncbi:MAG: DUF4350 domain-containing protein [Myxococcota bacterium]
MRDRFPLLVVGGLALLAFVGSFLFRGAARGAFADRLSTYRSERDGARGLYLLAEESGLPVHRLQRDMEVIEDEVNLVLLAVDPDDDFGFLKERKNAKEEEKGNRAPEDVDEEKHHQGMNVLKARGLTEREREELLGHVKEGHTLVYAPWDAEEDELLDALDVRLSPAQKELGLRTLVPMQPTPYTLGVERLEAHVRAHLDLPAEAAPLLMDDPLGEVVAALVPYGQGKVLVLSAPELASNAALARADNAQFWLSTLGTLAQEGAIAFDEFHHGFTSDRSIADFAARYGLQYSIAQLLLGLILWAGALRRFGRPRAAAEDERVGSTDALYAASRLYREGKHHAYAAMLVARGLTQELAFHAGLPARADAAEVNSALASRGRQNLSAALAEVTQLAHLATSEGAVLKVAQKAALARSLLHHTRRPNDRSATLDEGKAR